LAKPILVVALITIIKGVEVCQEEDVVVEVEALSVMVTVVPQFVDG
jgi:hypothetical protein